LFFLLAWWLFGHVSHEPATDATTRSLVPRKTARLRLFGAGRSWNRALAWKDFHFISGGWFGFLMRCGLYVGLYWLSYAATYPWDQSQFSGQIRWRDVTWGYQVFLPPVFAIDCALCASRVFHEEIRHQTLASLLMLPRTVPNIFYTKLAGCLFGLIPGMVALLTAFLLLEGCFEIHTNNNSEGFAWWYVANLLLAIHLCLVFSLYVRWGALAMGFALTFGSMMMTGVIIDLMRFRGGFMNPNDFLGFFAVPILLACVGCHLIILLRLPALGEK
jgi:hypothetical protein